MKMVRPIHFLTVVFATTAMLGLAGCRSPQATSYVHNADFYERAEARVQLQEMTAEEPVSGTEAETIATADATRLSNQSDRRPTDPASGESALKGVVEGVVEGRADGVARLSQPVLVANRVTPAGSLSRPHITPVPGVQAVSFSHAEPRLLVDDDGQPVGDSRPAWMDGRPADLYPDEYLLDGGDRDKPVHYDSYYRQGLETEDTVAEFRDSDGKSRTQATNQVSIYAPRFGAVRSVMTPSGDVQIARVAGMQDRVVNSGVGVRVGPEDYTRNDRLSGVRVRSRASGVETREWERGVFNTARLVGHTRLLNLRQDLSYWLSGSLEQADDARIAYGIDAALLWTRNENPVVTAQLASAGQVEAKFRAAEMSGSEPEGKTPGRLKIVKLADRKTAQPGDTITFVIRYSNTGERPLHDLRIVDNLTPRLEYMEDSATSDRPGDIIVEDNAEGSLVLTFKLDESLPGGTGGVVTFQCRVR